MTEEEVIKQIKDMIIAFDVQGYIREKGFIKEELKASNVLREMLDIYQKQKEELETEKHYAKVYENMVKDYEKICIEKNKRIEKLEEEIDQMNKDKWEGWLEANE